MANNYCQVTVLPYLPKEEVEQREERLEGTGLVWENVPEEPGAVYLYTEEYWGDSDEGESPVDILQEVAIAAGLDHIVVEGAYTCSAMRPGEFGGFAIWITQTEIDSISTTGWLRRKQAEHVDSAPA